ncbi:DNA primase large subunit isoform X2 [Narcine bancroftii]|uniref:DNA primase large subunit isoform X2 n=1 Tax=Narcine bancroftii TaxID=1343680 RepID=UPI0038310401
MNLCPPPNIPISLQSTDNRGTWRKPHRHRMYKLVTDRTWTAICCAQILNLIVCLEGCILTKWKMREELRRWFIQQELDLFRFRFGELQDKQQEFLKQNKLEYHAITEEEKEHLSIKLINSNGQIDQTYYKVPFTDVLELVRTRKAFIKNGLVYIPHPEIVIIILNEFRKRISKSLALTSRSLPVVQSDERLQPLLSHLSCAYVGQDYSIQRNVGTISLDQLDSLATKSYPPCMRQLHMALRDNHHLRHGGRMQYGLYIKGLGLTLEQALQFWKSEFIKGKVEPDKFDKLYAYNIRHNFGKEGKRTDYTPFSCMKIILSNPPGQGDYHGCPFRHSDPELLKPKLQSYNIPLSGINQILELVKGMHYQLACQKYFEQTHNIKVMMPFLVESDILPARSITLYVSSRSRPTQSRYNSASNPLLSGVLLNLEEQMGSINLLRVAEVGFSLCHPNQYFIESQKVLNSRRDAKKESSQSESSQRPGYTAC